MTVVFLLAALLLIARPGAARALLRALGALILGAWLVYLCS